MCARIVYQGVQWQPGTLVQFVPHGETEPRAAWWGGRTTPPFARIETLRQKWLSRGWKTGRIKGARFAERSQDDGELRWNLDPVDIAVVWKGEELAVVTRAATPSERKFYGHHRVPYQPR